MPLPCRPALSLASLALVLAAAGGSAGCSSGKSAEEQQLDELRDEITKVQATSDRFEQRLDKLEIDTADPHGSDEHATDVARAPARTTSAPIATPQLRVVHLGPDGLEEMAPPGETAGAVNDDPGDSTPRPHIRIQGTRAESLDSDADSADGRAGKTAHERPSASDPDAKRAYDSAFALVSSKKYAAALDALAGFLMRWPDHPNADNAMYWRGECYFAPGDWAHAAEQFDGVLARFPNGDKVADALLKLGMSKQHLGDDAGAKTAFDRLRREYPRSEAARRIPAAAAAAGPSEVKP